MGPIAYAWQPILLADATIIIGLVFLPLMFLEGIEGRVDDFHLRPESPGLLERVLPPGNAHHVAEGTEDDLGTRRDGMRPVQDGGRRHAHRAAGAVHQGEVVGADAGDVPRNSPAPITTARAASLASVKMCRSCSMKLINTRTRFR